VELPTLEGKDPLGWLACAEMFSMVQVKPSKKLKFAFISICEMHCIGLQKWRQNIEESILEIFF